MCLVRFVMEKDPLTDSESKLFEALQGLKKEVDHQIMQNAKLLENESFVEKMMMRLVIDQFKNKNDIPLDALTTFHQTCPSSLFLCQIWFHSTFDKRQDVFERILRICLLLFHPQTIL